LRGRLLDNYLIKKTADPILQVHIKLISDIVKRSVYDGGMVLPAR